MWTREETDAQNADVWAELSSPQMQLIAGVSDGDGCHGSIGNKYRLYVSWMPLIRLDCVHSPDALIATSLFTYGTLSTQ